jgi:uncharacterized protein (UPF0276 family)
MQQKSQAKFPYLGFGLGLRAEHYEDILNSRPALDWLEIITENYLVAGGKPLYYLDRIREHYPMVMHGVSLSLGGSDELDHRYLQNVKKLADRIQPVWISDHLCWTGVNGVNTHDLLPLPYIEEAITQVVTHIKQVQDILDRHILIENVSSYLTFENSQMTECEFLTAIAQEADCYILLDVNNIYVSACNHNFNALDYLRGIPRERVVQIHLAGHTNHGDYIVDTHDAPVIQPVWDLYGQTLKHFGAVSTMIERDDNIPPLSDLLAEVDQARLISNTVLLKPVAIS